MYPQFAVLKSTILLLGGSVQCDRNISEMMLSYNIQLGKQLYHSCGPVKRWNVYHLGFALPFHEHLVLTRGLRPHREHTAHVGRQLTRHPTHDLGRQLLHKLQQQHTCYITHDLCRQFLHKLQQQHTFIEYIVHDTST